MNLMCKNWCGREVEVEFDCKPVETQIVAVLDSWF